MRLPNAFTLVELLVVVSIIVVLGTAGMLVYETSLTAGNDTKRISDILQIQKALESYYATYGYYPSNLTDTNLSSYFQAGNVPCDPNINPCASATTGFPGYIYNPCNSSGIYTTTSPSTYNLCVQLSTCGNKCTSNSVPTQGSSCLASSAIVSPGSGNLAYCVKQVSN